MHVLSRDAKSPDVRKREIIKVASLFVHYVKVADQFVHRKLLANFKLIAQVGVGVDAHSYLSLDYEVHLGDFLILFVD